MENKGADLLRMMGSNDDAAFQNAVGVVRLEIAFDLLDVKRKGKVRYREAVKHLKGFLDGTTEKEEWNSLLIVEKEREKERIHFKDFLDLVLNLVALTSLKSHDKKVVFHEITNSIALSGCNEKMDRYSGSCSYRTLVE
mmetsp:Transcript_31170/g.71807  ORF Transcript_31170/g.71807 Transcript_31170/m.71807 type:complete len:139 (+) Transcript_31170:387-803(+)